MTSLPTKESSQNCYSICKHYFIIDQPSAAASTLFRNNIIYKDLNITKIILLNKETGLAINPVKYFAQHTTIFIYDMIWADKDTK